MIAVKFVLMTLWPVKYLIDDDFYEKKSVLYRFLYSIPMTFNFRFGFYTITYASEYFLHVNGFGAYPVDTEPKVARGPTKEITQDMIENAQDLEYTFLTIKTNDIKKLEGKARFDESVKNWNMTVQWWFSNYIFKRLPYKEHPWFSRVVTFAVSTFWHGNDLGYVIFLFPITLMVLGTDKLLVENFVQTAKSENGKKLAFIFQHAVKWFQSYFFVCVYLQSLGRIWRFYSSTNFIGIKIFMGYSLVLLIIHLKRKHIFSKLGKGLHSILF